MSQQSQEADKDDAVVRELAELPPFRAPPSHAARAAFVRAFEPTRWYEPAIGTATRASLPVVLGVIVVVYLSWAFSTASALMQ